MSLADLRRTYSLAGLRRADLNPDPFAQFKRWLQEALVADLIEPTAMTLATADRDGRPSARIVLLKGVEARGFLFFTNYDSRKGRDLEANPNAALVLYWAALERQVRISGTVSKCPRDESERYFHSRPRGHQLSAWVSNQSEAVAERRVLEERLGELQRIYPGTIPLPSHWGGYFLAPTELEFWQGRPDRLHDRFLYAKQPDASWRIERLAP